MKKRWIHLISGFTVFVLCTAICTTTANAAIVWQDDFSDPNLPGWTLYGYENTSSQVMIEGNFSAADGTLKVLDDKVNVAKHDSDMTEGTWSFDMFIPENCSGAVYVEFMSNGTYEWTGATNNSLVAVGFYQDKFIVWEWVGTYWEIFSNIVLDPLEGWHHIDVTRTSGGYFEFYFDGVLPTLALPPANFTNNDVTSSTYLQFYSSHGSGAAIDNLVVRDDFPTITSNGGDGGIDWTLIAIGGGVAVAVIVLAVVFLRRK